MTKAEYLKWYDLNNWETSMYDASFKAQYIEDDEEFVELAKTCMISSEDFQDYAEEALDEFRKDSGFTV